MTEPNTNLEKRKCSIHKELLKYYCTEDNACICVSCVLDGEHWGNRVKMLEEASEKKKEKLRNVLQKLITKREKTEERVRSLEKRRKKTQGKVARKAERVTALFIDIRRRLDDLEKRVLSKISKRGKEVTLSSSALIQQLGIKKDELSRKIRHIEELCNRTDPLTVLQDPDTGDLCDREEVGDNEDTKGHDGGDEETGGHDGGDEDTGRHDGGDEDTGRHDGGDEDTGRHDGGDEDTGGHDKKYDVDVDVITGMLQACFSDIIKYLQTITPAKQGKKRKLSSNHTHDLPASAKKKRAGDIIVRTGNVGGKVAAAGEDRIFGQGPAEILLDINTASNTILISDDLKAATRAMTNQNRPETIERFQYHQVISSGRFSSGRHYWDVEVSESSWSWSVGMCYPGINRMRRKSYIGFNNKSWCLWGKQLGTHEYFVMHDSKKIMLCHQTIRDRFRICLDYEAGQLSFYELCDPIRHLHTFTATFTEPLHAVLHVHGGSVKILGGAVAGTSGGT